MIAIMSGASLFSRAYSRRTPERRLADDDHQQLAGHQAAPGERPALLEPGDERRQRRRQDQVPVFREALHAQHLADPQPGPRHVVDAADQAVRHRRRGADDDHEQDRALAELEQQDGQREPHDRRHRLQAGDQRADRGPQRREPGHRARRSRCRSPPRAAKPVTARRQGEAARRSQKSPVVITSPRSVKTVPGPGSTYVRLPLRTRPRSARRAARSRWPAAWARRCARSACRARPVGRCRRGLERVEAASTSRVPPASTAATRSRRQAAGRRMLSWHDGRPPRGAGR